MHLISSACLDMDMDPTCHTRPTRKCLSVALNRNRDPSGACNRWTPCRCRRAACSFGIAGLHIEYHSISITLPSVSLDVHKSCFPLEALNSEIDKYQMSPKESKGLNYIHRSRGPTDTAATSKTQASCGVFSADVNWAHTTDANSQGS